MKHLDTWPSAGATHIDLYLLNVGVKVSDLNLHWLLQVTDGDVLDTAGYHVAV